MAGLFGVCLSPIKRYLKCRREGEYLSSKPSPGRTLHILSASEE